MNQQQKKKLKINKNNSGPEWSVWAEMMALYFAPDPDQHGPRRGGISPLGHQG